MVDRAGEPNRRKRHQCDDFARRSGEGNSPFSPGHDANELAFAQRRPINFRECRTACPGLVQARAADCRIERLAKEHGTGLRFPGEAGLQPSTRLRLSGVRRKVARKVP